MGLFQDVDTLKSEIEEKEKEFFANGVDDIITAKNDKNFRFKLLGKSIGKVISFAVLPAGEIGFTNLQLTFTDRGLYFYNGQIIPGGTNATYKGFAVPQPADSEYPLIFYGQGNGMSVAEVKPNRTNSTWLTEGVAGLERNLTGAGTYRGSILYRWEESGPFGVLNRLPAVFQLTINDFGFTFGTIYRWMDPNESTDSTASSSSSGSSSSGSSSSSSSGSSSSSKSSK